MADEFTLDFDFRKIPDFLDREKAMLVDAAADTMKTIERMVKEDVRAEMLKAVPGRRKPSRLGRGWRVNIYPKSGRSYTPTVEVRPDGKMTGRSWGALSSFAKGATIRARNGGWVIIPTDLVMRTSRLRNRNGETESPERWAFRTGRKLRLVVPKGKGYMLLVTDPPKRTKTGRKSRAKPEVAFILVRETGIHKRFDLRGVLQPYGDAIADEFVRRHKTLQRGAGISAAGDVADMFFEGLF